MSQRKLPPEWCNAKLGDIVPYGKTQKCVLSDVSDSTWVLELEDVEKESSRVLARKTAAERPFKSTKNIFYKGNVLYGKLRPYLNKVVLADEQGVCTTEIIPLDAEPFVLNRYLFYWLKTHDFLSYVNEVSYGVNMPRLGTKDGISAPMVLAPLAEQKIIADKLDTLLAQVDNTKARLERIPVILKRFRQSVLASAVSGRLTEADQLDWAKVSIDDLVEVINGKAFPSKEYQNNGVRLLRPGNLNVSGKVVWNEKNTTYIPRPWLKKRPELLLKSGALLMNLTAQSLADEFLGRVCMFTEVDEPVLLNQRICSFESRLEYDIRPYLFVLFRSPQFRTFVDILDTGTLIKHMNVKSIKSFVLRLPPREEQTEIVRRVDQLFAYAARIEHQVNQSLVRVNNLAQSILAKAFRGELTEQWRKDNPELISGKNSAEALLERIKAERVTVKQTRGNV